MSYRYDMIDLIAALIGSLIVGGFLGLVPLICGLVKKKDWPGYRRIFCLLGRRPPFGTDFGSSYVCSVYGADFCDKIQNCRHALRTVSGSGALSRADTAE